LYATKTEFGLVILAAKETVAPKTAAEHEEFGAIDEKKTFCINAYFDESFQGLVA
jgi:hypothetical protein